MACSGELPEKKVRAGLDGPTRYVKRGNARRVGDGEDPLIQPDRSEEGKTYAVFARDCPRALPRRQRTPRVANSPRFQAELVSQV